MLIFSIIIATIDAAILLYFIRKIINKDNNFKTVVHLPLSLAIFGIVINIAGAISNIFASYNYNLIWLCVSLLIMILGIAALLCQTNQKVVLISENSFTSTTFWGKASTYTFDEIKSIQNNTDSYTLFVENSKIHIESIALIEEEFLEKVNVALERHVENIEGPSIQE
ncbi:hypothetical protein RBG61_13840 [Paludicola sp. MB14-C6]|uniref:hypothetical protein n=1 Tax=Paludihabitans sp. MB14-C6 TaxID=3070656 RepID=UPI0027DC0FA9|nr:hypothetical protein [Paludicola sp. MB14-C6]WMJ23052.1 hypothetical protein RBG61_13840 [Paludicola sp. MB14-C6]